MPLSRPRPVQEVLDQLIRENRISEWLCYSMAGAFATVGISILVWACFVKGSWELTAASGIPSVLLWPAFRSVLEIRRVNMALRLLEIPLSQSTNAEATAKMLRDVFPEVFVPKRK